MPRPDNAAPTPPGPPLIDQVTVASLDRDGGENRFRLQPDAEARRRVADFLDIESVERMTMTGRIEPAGREGWLVRGQLTATVVQSCVVTLAPVRARIDVPVRREYQPGADPVPGAEVELHAGDLDAPDPLGRTIDLGQLAVETLALSLDPWPRAAGAEIESEALLRPEGDALDAGDERPFASLAELRDRLARDKG